VPDVPELSTGDILHGQALLAWTCTAQETPALYVPGLELGSSASGPGDQGEGRRWRGDGDEDSPGETED